MTHPSSTAFSPDESARELMSAYRTGTAVAPLTERFPTLSVEDAYSVQLAQVRYWEVAGAEVIGFKIGLTSAAIQRQLGVDSPDFGHLMRGMEYPETLPIDPGVFLSPRVEPEVAFVLRDELSGPGVTARAAAAAIDVALPALEIIDSRIVDWRIALVDTIADNASSGGFVLGTQPVTLAELELPTLGCVLSKNGDIVQTGAGGAVLGNPLNAVAWLANAFGTLGRSLPAGSIILAGALSAAVPVVAGDRVTARFAGLGRVSVRFAQFPFTHEAEGVRT